MIFNCTIILFIFYHDSTREILISITYSATFVGIDVRRSQDEVSGLTPSNGAERSGDPVKAEVMLGLDVTTGFRGLGGAAVTST